MVKIMHSISSSGEKNKEKAFFVLCFAHFALPLQPKYEKRLLPRWWNGRHEGLKIPWP